MSKGITKKDRVLLLAVGIAVAALAYYLLVQQPLAGRMAAAEDSIKMLEADRNMLLVRQGKVRSMEQEIAQSEEKPIPDYDNSKAAIAFLHTLLSGASQYALSYGDPVPVSEDGAILASELQLQFTESSYERAREVLDRLQACPYRCVLDHLELRPGGDGAGNGTGSLTEGPVDVSVSVIFLEYQEPQPQETDKKTKS